MHGYAEGLFTMRLTSVAGPIPGPLSRLGSGKSESDFKNGHISRFCFVFQIIQVISSGKFAEEVPQSFFHEQFFKDVISKASFWKRGIENVFLSNVLIRE